MPAIAGAPGEASQADEGLPGRPILQQRSCNPHTFSDIMKRESNDQECSQRGFPCCECSTYRKPLSEVMQPNPSGDLISDELPLILGLFHLPLTGLIYSKQEQ